MAPAEWTLIEGVTSTVGKRPIVAYATPKRVKIQKTVHPKGRMRSYCKEDPESIQEMFSTIAERYDAGNAALSLQLFRLWNKRLINQVLLPHPHQDILDLCCGTGEITFTYLKQLRKLGHPVPNGSITLMDFSEGMLRVAQQKAAKIPSPKLHFIRGDAQAIPLPAASVDAVVIAYGIRNVVSPQLCLEETYRILRPGGRLGILELTRPNHILLKLGHAVYLRIVVPILGRLITSNAKAYHYLQQSVQGFVSVPEMQNLMRLAGFQDSTSESLTGGIATLFIGQKPII